MSSGRCNPRERLATNDLHHWKTHIHTPSLGWNSALDQTSRWPQLLQNSLRQWAPQHHHHQAFVYLLDTFKTRERIQYISITYRKKKSQCVQALRAKHTEPASPRQGSLGLVPRRHYERLPARLVCCCCMLS